MMASVVVVNSHKAEDHVTHVPSGEMPERPPEPFMRVHAMRMVVSLNRRFLLARRAAPIDLRARGESEIQS